MGMDAVFVHLVEKYYMTNQAYWVDSTQLAKITDAAMSAKPLLIGKKAPAIYMKDSTGKYITMSEIKADYTVIAFWAHDCGHCKTSMPKLYKAYDSILRQENVAVYAVETEDKPEPWKKFIKENNFDWINVHETNAGYRAYAKKSYNVRSTPLIYILDENKVIKAKKVDAEQVANIIEMLRKSKKAKEEAKLKSTK
jgi:peroxiredoxin